MKSIWLGGVTLVLTLVACSSDDGTAPQGDDATAGSGGTGVSTAGSGPATVAGTAGSVGGAPQPGTAGSGPTPAAGSTSGPSGGTGSQPEPSPVGTCSSVGETKTLSASIVVGSGETFDGKCARYVADPDELGDGSQDEGQEPMFVLEDGATLLNVVMGAPAADGIHTEGDATLKNITWQDIGEDALTVEGEGTVTLDGGSASKGADKVFQINAESTFKLSNFKATDAGKLVRQNGGTGFATHVFIDRCDVSNMKEAIFRTDSGTSTVSMTNTRYRGIGEALFIGVSDDNITTSNNSEY